ncbi:hypothetical protein [Luteimonas granuli]|uniref:DUF3828 domain-containing protein n=1 Tax=Luteimonas granuli TaxID=1176533 RepID=A0A518N4J7_9GAMM|nr:hypothetical protein [Luteimonas granuli]QDW66828.1 hypothetical protein FPZ22_07910 [Luteimonas granuli]
MPPFLRPLLVATAAAGLALVACRPAPPDAAVPLRSDLSRPTLAVQALTGHMRSGDFAAFARDAVPPALHARLQDAWRAGHTRWPLDELPFSEHLPGILGALAAPDAEAALTAGFERQFAGHGREIRAAAATVGMFGVQYVSNQGDFSDHEREHYAQLVTAVAHWAARAPLSDRAQAAAAIARLAEAARAAGPTTAEGIAAAGMDASLQRLGAFSSEVRAVLAGYGLDLDAAFDSVEAGLQVQQGDKATVRLRYTLAGTAIDTVVPVERIDGRWYLSDFLRHARSAASGAAAADPPGPVAVP